MSWHMCCDRFGKARIGSSAATIYSNMVRGNASVFDTISSLIAALLLLSSRQQASLFTNFVGAERTQFAMCAYTCSIVSLLEADGSASSSDMVCMILHDRIFDEEKYK